MAGVLKILFDLSLYYTLTGFYLICVSGQAPSAVCFLALVCCASVDALLRTRGVKNRLLRSLPFLLPFLALPARPGLIPFLHCVPAWAYVALSCLTERLEVRYDGFRTHFGFGLKCLLLLVLGPLFPGVLKDAALGTVPYLVLMLVTGVCLLRLLREGRSGGVRQALYMAVFVLVCAGLTLGHAPQLLLKGVGLLWRAVVAPAVFLVAVVLAAALYIFYLLAKWLVARAQGETPPLDLSLQSTAEMLGIEDQYKQYTADLRWLKTLLLVLFCAFLAFALFLLFRRLLGDRLRPSDRVEKAEKRAVLPGAAASERSPGRIRPREPRLAVRWYFARFLDECVRRGMALERGMTVSEVCERSEALFPGADVRALSALYLPARYQAANAVTREDARRAAEAWNALRRSESPADRAKRQKKKNNP